MDVFNYTSKGVKYRHIWYNEAAELREVDARGVDVLEFKESLTRLDGLYGFRNGVVMINDTRDRIFDRFDKGFKYEVRRAEKDGHVCSVVELDESTLRTIYQAYESFSKAKGIVTSPFSLLSLYAREKHMRVTQVIVENIPVQFHIYFVSRNEDILLASFPAIDTGQIKKTALGFANRYLHWFDIQLAIDARKAVYNLGGIGNSDNPSTAGIVKFKMEMSPEVREYYHGIIPVSLKGRSILFIKKMLKKYA